jgi:hypothetical protein
MVKVASLLDMPPAVRYFFDDGSMLYNDEKIITPNERLNPVDKKELLSSILKFLRPGNWRMIRSTHITDAVCGISMDPIYLESAAQPKKTSPPTVQAMPLTTAMIQPRVSLSSMLRGAVRHAGTFLRDVERRSRTRPGMFVRGELRRVHLLMYADFRSSKC